eukprot:TRINITY_DN61330_c0_g1_i1.p1 TRINITY_DN61330_c0_g1~~TRINITY_DN61330_c0_g1_i1.p1  ORF type:complete len:448 (-),score=89.29 TRINITY_DN61330_c0_g1_i1:130-1473(-)
MTSDGARVAKPDLASQVFQQLINATGASREACFFDNGVSKIVDANLVCHEIRYAQLAEGERLGVSFCDESDKRDNSMVFAAVGEVCSLKALKLKDAVIAVGVWAISRVTSLGAPTSGGFEEHGGGVGETPGRRQPQQQQQRFLGVVKVPVQSLITRCNGALYHSWLLLSSRASSSSDEESFHSALMTAHREASLKACVSILRSADLDASGRALWTLDAGKKERISRWGPLLRSQEQHEQICALQQQQHRQGRGRSGSLDGSRDNGFEPHASNQSMKNLSPELRRQLEKLQMEARDQGREFLSLCMKLPAAEGAGAVNVRFGGDSGDNSVSEHMRRKLEGLQTEFSDAALDANNSIAEANDKIRELRKEREEAKARNRHLYEEQSRASALRKSALEEKERLVKQKEALLKIVEDLHQTCDRAGFGAVGRKSIEASTSIRTKKSTHMKI